MVAVCGVVGEMNPTTGRTSGRHGGWQYSHTRSETWTNPTTKSGYVVPVALVYKSVDGCKHCPHADLIRLRRLPKWLQYVEHMPATGQRWWPVGRRVFKQEIRRQMALPVPF